MAWRKNVFGDRNLDLVTLIGFVLLIFSFYQKTVWLSILVSFLIVINQMGKYYLHHVADHLELENNKETIRLSIGEKFSLPIRLTQHSYYPIFQATLTIKMEAFLEGDQFSFSRDETNIQFKIPLQLKGKETIQIDLPLIATSRGVTRIKLVELSVPNFFGLGHVELKYDDYIHKEFIIHPNQSLVPQADQLVATMSQGDYPTPTSMFEQILAPIGTRDYVYSDSFQRIHWKASAKTGVLQTKVFERTSHYSWTILVNLREPHSPNYQMGVVENVETIARHVAYLAQYATKKFIDFELFLNLRMANQGAAFHLPKGNGTQQLGKVLDSLAYIHRKGNTLPIMKLFQFFEKQQQHSPVVIVCGPYGEEDYRYFSHLQKKGQRVYLLQSANETPTLLPLGRS